MLIKLSLEVKAEAHGEITHTWRIEGRRRRRFDAATPAMPPQMLETRNTPREDGE